MPSIRRRKMGHGALPPDFILGPGGSPRDLGRLETHSSERKPRGRRGRETHEGVAKKMLLLIPAPEGGALGDRGKGSEIRIPFRTILSSRFR